MIPTPQTAKQNDTHGCQLGCVLIVCNEVLDVHSKMLLPETVEEAMENCLAITQAMQHIEELESLDRYPTMDAMNDGDRDLGVMIRKTAEAVIVRWWAAGDVEKARMRLRAIQNRGPVA